ncbi:hypothetical protein [Candidatus Poriferisocius sp.]
MLLGAACAHFGRTPHGWAIVVEVDGSGGHML